MNDPEIIYEDAKRERRMAEKRAGEELEESIAFARRLYRDAISDALHMHKIRVSLTRNPHCHVCSLEPPLARKCNCLYKCPSTLCKGEE